MFLPFKSVEEINFPFWSFALNAGALSPTFKLVLCATNFVSFTSAVFLTLAVDFFTATFFITVFFAAGFIEALVLAFVTVFFTANFLGDKVLKNMGFTIGAIGAGALTGGGIN